MKTLLFLALTSLSVQAMAGTTEATCGEVKKVSNGKILKRLQPSIFGINAKFVLKTKFYNYITLNESNVAQDISAGELTHKQESAFTAFSDKEKFLAAKKDLKSALKKSNSVWACVGHISIPLKYEGSHAYVSEISLEDAMEQFKKQVKRHSYKPLRITL